MYEQLHSDKFSGMEEKGVQQGKSLSSPGLIEVILVIVYKVVLRGKKTPEV